MPAPSLPYIDTITVPVAAPPDVVWPVLLETFGAPLRAVPGRLGALLLGARPAPDTASAPGLEGLRGFGVREVDAPRRLLLAGRHRFSDYTLRFGLAPTPAGTELSAETHAAFPGVTGALYRAAVIRSHAHALLVGRILQRVRRRAEAAGR